MARTPSLPDRTTVAPKKTATVRRTAATPVNRPTDHDLDVIATGMRAQRDALAILVQSLDHTASELQRIACEIRFGNTTVERAWEHVIVAARKGSSGELAKALAALDAAGVTIR